MSRTIIIGGGAIGLSVAYHLGKRNAGEVILLERNQLTSGTSWHAAGIVGPLRATSNLTRLASHALELFPRLEKETGMSTGYQRTGGYFLARESARLDELNRIANIGKTQGLTPQMIDPQEIRMPTLSTDGLVGVLRIPEDGNVNPVDLCMAYAHAAKSMGIEICEGVTVSRLMTQGGRVGGVMLGDGTEYAADRVVLCTGAWSRELAATADVALPLQAVEHMYVVTEPMADLPNPFPVIRDLDHGIYIKGDVGKLVIGGFERDAKCWNPYGTGGDRPFVELPEDWDQFAPFMEAALELIPGLRKSGILHFMNGPESFTADTRPLVGPPTGVDGLYVAAGMNSLGVMSSAGIGYALAGWIDDGTPPFDMWEVDIARVDPKTADAEHIAARMKEAVADLFAIHWPYKQPQAGRSLRISPLHDRWAAAGAYFGQTAGWERGLWYAQNSSERKLAYSTGAQHWWPIAEREARRMVDGAALLDLTPFTKIDIEGSAAVSELNRLTTAQMDVKCGGVVYTQLLNTQGGIEMDVTVSRLGSNSFRLVSGAAARQRDMCLLRRNLSGCSITDVTEHYCMIGVMGAGAVNALAHVTSEKFWAGASLGESREASLAGHCCRAARISFVGEYGWELTVANAGAADVFNALYDAGARPMGHYALDGCRMEKGFKHWGHDIGPRITPLESGLGFTIDWSKDFVGKQTLQRQKTDGVRQRLVLLRIDGDALLLHDEPIYTGTTHVGFTTSGAMGPRTGLNLAFGLISASPGETPAETCERKFRVRVAGEEYPATALRKAPFDPTGKRMQP